MKIKHQKNFLTGIIFMIVGVVFSIGANGYSFGSAAHMGPGYFPTLVGGLLSGLGLFMSISAMLVGTSADDTGKWVVKPMLLVVGSNVVFGLLLGGLHIAGFHLPIFGMVAGIYALTFITSFANDSFNWKEVFVLATVLSILSYVVFILLLKIQMEPWPMFLSK